MIPLDRLSCEACRGFRQEREWLGHVHVYVIPAHQHTTIFKQFLRRLPAGLEAAAYAVRTARSGLEFVLQVEGEQGQHGRFAITVTDRVIWEYVERHAESPRQPDRMWDMETAIFRQLIHAAVRGMALPDALS